MLDNKAFKQIEEEAVQALTQGHLHEAFDLIRVLADDYDIENRISTLDSMQRFYDSMLQITSEGTAQEQRLDHQLQLLHELYAILTKFSWFQRVIHTTDLYGNEAKKSINDLNTSAIQTTMKEGRYKDALDLMFRLVWTTEEFNTNLNVTINDADLLERQYFLSALMLATNEYFCEERMALLARYSLSEDACTRIRALTGLLTACMIHGELIASYPKTEARIKEVLSDKAVRHDVALIQKQFLLLGDSEKIQSEISENIIPKLNKLLNNPRLKLGFNHDENTDAIESLIHEQELTPADKKARKSVQSNIKRLGEMFMMGFDINKGAFTRLRTAPFFTNPAHWFLPFNPDREEIYECLHKQDGTPIEIQQLITSTDNVCDTDKYALCFMLKSMFGKDVMTKLESINEKFATPEMTAMLNEVDKMAKSDEAVCRNYMQCLTRFYNESPWKTSITRNPFLMDTDFIKYNGLNQILTHDEEYMTDVARMLTKLGHTTQAIEYWDIIDHTFGSTTLLFRQRGLCHQQQGDYAEAINDYRQADILEPHNTWTLSQMQLCYDKLERYDKQLKCLLQLEAIVPDNIKITTETGLCLMKLERWKDAAQRFYKMELEGKREVPSIRAIAWCAFMQKDYERATKYYKRLIYTPSAKWEDYLNAAHIAFITDDTKAALPLYAEYISHYLHETPEAKDALKPFNDDAKILYACGKTKYDVAFLYDMIQAQLKQN